MNSNYDLVAPRLWQGSAPDPTKPYPEFDVIVLAAKEAQPMLQKFRGRVIRAPFSDARYPTETERRIAIRAARVVAKELKKGNKVLVTCAQGLNRSGLIVGLALRMASKYDVEEIIRRIRAARGNWALTNPSFERFLRGFGARKTYRKHR